MRSATLYRFYNAGGELLYVGQSINFGSRLVSHRAIQPWFSDASTVTLEHFPSNAEAKAAETHAIQAEAPRFNRSGVAPELRAPRADTGLTTIVVRVPKDLLREYAELVAGEERTVSQDIRLYIKRRVERAQRDADRTAAA